MQSVVPNMKSRGWDGVVEGVGEAHLRKGSLGKQGEGQTEAESGELLPASLGRGPGECSVCRGLVGPPSLPLLRIR